MFASVVSAFTRLLAYVVRPVIGLRYRIEVRGLDAIKRKGPKRHPLPAKPLVAAGPGLHRRAPVPRVPAAPACGRTPGQPDRLRYIACSTVPASCRTWNAAAQPPAIATLKALQEIADG